MMTKSLITFPGVVDELICRNCKTTLGIKDLLSNLTDMTNDLYGMPAIMVKCPICRTLLEWETRCN